MIVVCETVCRLCFALGCLIAAAASLPAQRVWVVDKFNRPGADFTSIQAAVDAAASGDMIRIRATTSAISDRYIAPSVQAKSLAFSVDSGAVRPIIGGAWTFSNVAGQSVISGMELMSNSADAPARIVGVACAGAIVLNDVVMGLILSAGLQCQDCRCLVINGCVLTYSGSCEFLRCNVVITDSVLRCSNWVPYLHNTGWQAIRSLSSTVTIMGSTIVGTSASHTLWPDQYSPAISMCDTVMTIGAGSHIESGQPLGGGFSSAVGGIMGCRPNTICHLNVDWASITWWGSWPALNDPFVIYDQGPQTAISLTQTATTLQVDQHANPPSLTVLALGALTTTPWTNVVGPVFLDPAGAIDFFDAAPSTGSIQRTFAIPAGLPPGTSVAVQAFELAATGRIMTSNVCVAGIW